MTRSRSNKKGGTAVQEKQDEQPTEVVQPDEPKGEPEVGPVIDTPVPPAIETPPAETQAERAADIEDIESDPELKAQLAYWKSKGIVIDPIEGPTPKQFKLMERIGGPQ